MNPTLASPGGLPKAGSWAPPRDSAQAQAQGQALVVRAQLWVWKPPQTRLEEKLNQLTTAQGEAQTMTLENPVYCPGHAPLGTGV